MFTRFQCDAYIHKNLSQLKWKTFSKVESCRHELLEAVAECIGQQVAPRTVYTIIQSWSIHGWVDPICERDSLLLEGADGDVCGVRG